MSSYPLSERARNTPASPIRRLSPLAAEARSRGTNVIPLNIGQPDIPSPDSYFAALRQFQQPVIAYEASRGNDALCENWAAYMNRSLNLSLSPDQFLITIGASEALIFLFMICADPGDEILVFDPSYANYISFAATAGVTLRPVLCAPEDGFHLPPEEAIRQQISPRTKALLLCNPNNPTGTVYTADELKALISLAHEYGIFLIVDETYREFVYGDSQALSVLSLAPADPSVIVVDSLSKRFSLCGARIGAIVTANAEVLRLAYNLAQARLAGPTIEQYAAAAMLKTMNPQFVENVRLEYLRRRNALCDALANVAGISFRPPEGAFYTLVSIEGVDADRFCSRLLANFSHDGETVFLAPATGFYITPNTGRSLVRIAFVLNEADISRAIHIVDRAIQTRIDQAV